MRHAACIPLCALVTGTLLLCGCVAGPDRGHERAYEHQREAYGYDRERDRDLERHGEYERCREQGGRDCDDILHHSDDR